MKKSYAQRGGLRIPGQTDKKEWRKEGENKKTSRTTLTEHIVYRSSTDHPRFMMQNMFPGKADVLQVLCDLAHVAGWQGGGGALDRRYVLDLMHGNMS